MGEGLSADGGTKKKKLGEFGTCATLCSQHGSIFAGFGTAASCVAQGGNGHARLHIQTSEQRSWMGGNHV